MEENYAVNLLPEKKPEEYPLHQQFYYWTINIGRVLIIFTELIVLSVFFARFNLDREINDLSERITILQSIYESYDGLEERFRLVQNRLDAVNKVKKQQVPYTQGLMMMAQAAPTDLILTKLYLEQEVITLQATATSPTDFADFITALSSREKITDIALTSCNFNREARTFSLAVKISLGAGFYQQSGEKK